jgi:hypothetical protein
MPPSIKARVYTRYKKEADLLIKKCNSVRKNGVIFNFTLPIGAVELSPSRETIEDTDANTETIWHYYKANVEQLLLDVESNLVSYTTSILKFAVTIKPTYDEFATAVEILHTVCKKDVLESIYYYLSVLPWNSADGAVQKTVTVLSDVAEVSVICGKTGYNYTAKGIDQITNIRAWSVSSGIENFKYGQLNYTNMGNAKVSYHKWYIYKDAPIYICNTGISNLKNWYSTNKDKYIRVNGDTIPLAAMYCMSDTEEFNIVKTALGSLVRVIDPNLFVIPKKPRVNVVKTKASMTKVFEILFSNVTSTAGVIHAGDFYSVPLNGNVEVHVVKYTNDSYNYDWNKSYIMSRTKLPIIILRELRSGETKTKRFIAWADGKIINTQNNDFKIENLPHVLKNDYINDFCYLQEFVVARSILALSTFNTNDLQLGRSKATLYKFLLKYTYFKYYHKVVSKKAYRVIFERIWLTYRDGVLLDSIFNELNGYATHKAAVIPRIYNLKSLDGPNTNINGYKLPTSCEIIKRIKYEYYDWLFTHPNFVPEIKTFINNYLENNKCLSHI